MSIDLLTALQEKMGCAPLKKIDPNTGDVIDSDKNIPENLIAQAVIPTALAGIYELSKSDEGIKKIKGEDSFTNWSDILFGEHKQKIVGNIAGYAVCDFQQAEIKLNTATSEAINLIRKNTVSSENDKALKEFIALQRNNILPYLPPALHIGGLLNATIDDSTTKMQGPISTLMHKIETGFGGHETKKDAEDKKDNY